MNNQSPFTRALAFFVQHKIITFLLTLLLIAAGIYYAPFNWNHPALQRDPVPVDAIPDVGENQQIVFVDWMGQSAADVEQYITKPLAGAMLAVSGVKTVRASSMSGMASVYVIFDEKMDFHQSRARILERLASLPQDLLPKGVVPALGPDASPLGQVFWFTLEGVDPKTGTRRDGWELTELRYILDSQVRPALAATPGVAEVAPVGHGACEYQVVVDPSLMRRHNVTMANIFKALENSGADLGVGTFEINGVEYFIRALGGFRSPEDVRNAIVKANPPDSPNGPGAVRIADVAEVKLALGGHAGGLDRYGKLTIGAVAVARYGENPLKAIEELKKNIALLAPTLPQKTLADGQVSQVKIVPFYDRSQLIGETLHTLSSALRQQILITIVVIVFMLMHLRAGFVVSLLMPLSVLACFILMRQFKVDANLVSLSGIAIAIGTISDMGIILSENILARLRKGGPPELAAAPSSAVPYSPVWVGNTRPASAENRATDSTYEAVLSGTTEVGGAVLTAVATTIVGFLPVFALSGPEGKLFKPLAYTKTFCLAAAIILTLTILPALSHLLYGDARKSGILSRLFKALLLFALAALCFHYAYPLAAGALAVLGGWLLIRPLFPESAAPVLSFVLSLAAGLLFGYILALDWMPLGLAVSRWHNVIFTWALLLGAYAAMELFIYIYPAVLAWCLRHKLLFMCLPLLLCLWGLLAWLGFARVFAFAPKAAEWGKLRTAESVRSTKEWQELSALFPGLGKEFMPSFDEGTFLYMPTVMPHAGVSEVEDLINRQDKRFAAIPEVYDVAGKFGRADSALDPAPLSMFETIISYHPEYLQDQVGNLLTFKFDPDADDVFRDANGKPVLDAGEEIPVTGRFSRDDAGQLIPDPSGRPFRQWRPRLANVNDLWKEIEKAGAIPGITGAPKLYPIEARMVMLQTGIRAPMGIKIQGDNLVNLQKTADDIERLLRRAPLVNAGAVAADRSLGRPYYEITPNRYALAKRGMIIKDFEHFLETAIAGTMTANYVYEDRQRLPVRPRILKENRESPEALASLPVPMPSGGSVPLSEVAEVKFTQGPEMIASEGSRLVTYVVFDRKEGASEVETVEAAREYLSRLRERGEFIVPGGVTYSFTGSYENQVRSERVFMVIVPVALAAIFLIIYLQFRKIPISLLLFSGVPIALAGGMILLWLYGQDWFLGREIFGVDLRELLHIRSYNLSVAVWVGFLALFGIATDDGVVMATYLEQSFARGVAGEVGAIREAVQEAGLRRVRPCLMTSATTLLALLPVLTSGGKGSEIMIPMAIPSFGGMAVAIITMFVLPVSYCWLKERALRRGE